jgi:hypothetical protein
MLFAFPSSPRDVKQDGDGNDKGEQSLQQQGPVAVTALCAADLGDFVKGMPAPTSIFSRNPLFNQLFWWRLAKSMAGWVCVV